MKKRIKTVIITFITITLIGGVAMANEDVSNYVNNEINILKEELTKANNKCDELQEVIDNVELDNFERSELVEN